MTDDCAAEQPELNKTPTSVPVTESAAVDAAAPAELEGGHEQAPDAIDAAASVPPEQSLEDLEVQVRERLKKLVDRARAVQESARHLAERGRSLEDARTAGEAMMQRQDGRLEDLIAQEEETARQRAERIRELQAEFERDLEIRTLVGDCRAEAWADFANTIIDPADCWLAQIQQQRSDHRRHVAELQGWLEAAEQRWTGGGNGARGRSAAAPPNSTAVHDSDKRGFDESPA